MGSRRSAGVYVTEDIDEEYLSNLERSRSDSEKMKRVWVVATVTCLSDSRACHCVFAFERFSVIQYFCSRAHYDLFDYCVLTRQQRLIVSLSARRTDPFRRSRICSTTVDQRRVQVSMSNYFSS
jgi:hypothetical protein